MYRFVVADSFMKKADRLDVILPTLGDALNLERHTVGSTTPDPQFGDVMDLQIESVEIDTTPDPELGGHASHGPIHDGAHYQHHHHQRSHRLRNFGGHMKPAPEHDDVRQLGDVYISGNELPMVLGSLNPGDHAGHPEIGFNDVNLSYFGTNNSINQLYDVEGPGAHADSVDLSVHTVGLGVDIASSDTIELGDDVAAETVGLDFDVAAETVGLGVETTLEPDLPRRVKRMSRKGGRSLQGIDMKKMLIGFLEGGDLLGADEGVCVGEECAVARTIPIVLMKRLDEMRGIITDRLMTMSDESRDRLSSAVQLLNRGVFDDTLDMDVDVVDFILNLLGGRDVDVTDEPMDFSEEPMDASEEPGYSEDSGISASKYIMGMKSFLQDKILEMNGSERSLMEYDESFKPGDTGEESFLIGSLNFINMMKEFAEISSSEISSDFFSFVSGFLQGVFEDPVFDFGNNSSGGPYSDMDDYEGKPTDEIFYTDFYDGESTEDPYYDMGDYVQDGTDIPY